MRELIDYISGLTITQGEGAGGPFPMFPWERRFLMGAFRPDVDESGLCIARGNGKTTLCAAIAAAVLNGPLSQARAEVVIVGSSFDQGKIAGDHTKAFLPYDRRKFRYWDSATKFQIRNKYSGVTLKCIGSDPRRAHGLAPALVLADEPAQWERTKAGAMLSALRTALGKIPGSRLIALGTRPDDDDHWFSRFLDGEADFSLNFQAPEDRPPFQKKTWCRANPSLPYFPNLEKRIRKEAALARVSPDALASFRAMRLNQGTGDVVRSRLIEAEEWSRVETRSAKYDGFYVLGLDLGTTKAMSAAAAFWPESGAMEAVAAYPQNPTLKERGIADGVGNLYTRMYQRGELIIAGLYTSDISLLLAECLANWGRPDAIVCDRWREGELREALQAAKFPITKLVFRGQGYKDQSEDVRLFQRAVADGEVTPSISLLLRSALSEARLMRDPAGNQKIAKKSEAGRRQKARDDAAVAAVVAVGEGMRRFKRKPQRKRRRLVVAG